MCVGFTNGYQDFEPQRIDDAIRAIIPGSAVSFSRIGFYHFAIFLGWAWPRGGDSEPIPLLCHLSGDASTKPMASVRLDDFRDIVQNSTIRVYSCTCTATKRSQVILECLYRVGKVGYNPVTNNCEHFVRGVICGERVSYQARWTLAAPIVQLPRLIFGGAVVGATSSGSSSSSSGSIAKFGGKKSLGLLNPEMDLIEIIVSKRGLNLKGIKLNSICTREFEGTSNFPMQILYSCRSCSATEKVSVCRPCQKLCHSGCKILDGKVTEDVCHCSHTKKRAALQLPPRQDIRDDDCRLQEADEDSALSGEPAE